MFVAIYAENYKSRQLPLVVGNVILIGSQIMFMEAPTYWLMCFARALQGIGSTMVWVIGLALMCVGLLLKAHWRRLTCLYWQM